MVQEQTQHDHPEQSANNRSLFAPVSSVFAAIGQPCKKSLCAGLRWAPCFSEVAYLIARIFLWFCPGDHRFGRSSSRGSGIAAGGRLPASGAGILAGHLHDEWLCVSYPP